MRRSVVLVAAVLGAMLLPAGDATHTVVVVDDYDFTPSTVNVDAGEVVTWHWHAGYHSVESAAGRLWCSARGWPSDDCVRTFPVAGSFPYRCAIHPTTMTGTVHVAAVPGAASVVVTAPAGGATVQGAVAFTGSASHASGVAAIAAQVDSGVWQVANGTGSWAITLDLNLVPNGWHTVNVRATPVSGPAGYATLDVLVSNPVVAVSFSTPGAGATVAGNVSVTGAATHGFNSITAVKWRAGTGPWTDATLSGAGSTVAWSAWWNTTHGANGPQTLFVQAFDGYYHQTSTIVARNVVVANGPISDLRWESFSAAGGVGQTTIGGTVRHAGPSSLFGLEALFEYYHKGVWRPLGVSTFDAGPDSTVAVSFRWGSTRHLGDFPVRALLDPDGRLAETDEANNLSPTATATFGSSLLPATGLFDPLP